MWLEYRPWMDAVVYPLTLDLHVKPRIRRDILGLWSVEIY